MEGDKSGLEKTRSKIHFSFESKPLRWSKTVVENITEVESNIYEVADELILLFWEERKNKENESNI